MGGKKYYILLFLFLLAFNATVLAQINFFTPPINPLKIRYGTFVTTNSDPKGTLVLLPGRCEIIEQYDEVIKHLNDTGYDVWIMDWRGQGASDKDPHAARYNSGHVDSYDIYLHDLHEFLTNVVHLSCTHKAHVISHSMGGHITVRYLIEQKPVFFKSVVLYSPMIDILTPFSYSLVQTAVQSLCHLGFSKWVYGDQHSHTTFEGNYLTSDEIRWKDHVRKYKHYEVDGYTFQWIHETFKSITTLKTYPKQSFESITSPVLLLSGEDEQIVDPKGFDWFFRMLKADPQRKRWYFYRDARHCILREKDHLFHRAMNDIISFLEDPYFVHPASYSAID